MSLQGTPFPLDSLILKGYNLNALVSHPVATFFVRVSGDSMIGAGIYPDDVLIIDRAIEARHNHVIVAVLNSEFVIKRLKMEEGKLFLVPENPSYKRLEITQETDFQVWGVVTYAIHRITGENF